MAFGLGDDIARTDLPTGDADIEKFLFNEARLLDERRFEEWLDCLAPDFTYRVTSATMSLARERSDTTPTDAVLIDEAKEHVVNRVRRLETGMAWAEEPPSRTRRLISNVVVGQTEADLFAADSVFLLHRCFGEKDEMTLIGGRRDQLRRGGPLQWLLVSRHVALDQHVVSANHISVFM